jgi:hypothetical protein
MAKIDIGKNKYLRDLKKKWYNWFKKAQAGSII